MRRISLDSIKKHPGVYAKFVSTMLYTYYYTDSTCDADFLSLLETRATAIYLQNLFSPEKLVFNNVALPIKYSDVVPELVSQYPPLYELPIKRISGRGADSRIIFNPARPYDAYHVLYLIRHKLFVNRVWSFGFFIIFIISFLRLLVSRVRHEGAFIVFLIASGAFGASLTVCLVEFPVFRYSYPTEFVYYLAFALAPLMAGPDSNPRETPPEN